MTNKDRLKLLATELYIFQAFNDDISMKRYKRKISLQNRIKALKQQMYKCKAV